MKRTFTILMLALAALLTSNVFADTATPRIDRREARQHARIVRGERNGQLTRAETRRLRAGQRHVRRMERRAKADGQVTMRERRHINRAQNRQSRKIYRLKHNHRNA